MVIQGEAEFARMEHVEMVEVDVLHGDAHGFGGARGFGKFAAILAGQVLWIMLPCKTVILAV